MKLSLYLTLALLGTTAQLHAVTISTVPVGNAGNAADTTGYGAVAYDYRIGTTEVTNAQFAEFLNAKAESGQLGLYIDHSLNGIARSGVSGSFTYAPKPNMSDKPATVLTWFAAIRFANWLHNGQGSGDTETGAYTLVGDTGTPSNGVSITRNPEATWFLPSEDEWYKAAYHQPAAQGGDTDDYWLYPTATNSVPIHAAADSVGNISNPGPNVANYGAWVEWNSEQADLTTVDSAGPLSRSFYGTADQGGNAYEWTETLVYSPFRGWRGGALDRSAFYMRSSSWYSGNTEYGAAFLGFRVATIAVPEPSTYALATIGAIGLLAFRRRKAKA